MKAKSPREFAAFGRCEQDALRYYEMSTHALLNFYVRICGEFVQSFNNVVNLLLDFWEVVIVPPLRGLYSPEGEHFCRSMNVHSNGLRMQFGNSRLE